MPLFETAAKKAARAQRAAAIGGREGWPTEEWNKGKRKFISYSPYFRNLGNKYDPISGMVNGRIYATCAVSTSFSRQVGINTTRTTTYYHTAAIFPDTCYGVPLFDVVSMRGGWDQVQKLDKLVFNTGDQQFHQYFIVAANAADRQFVYSFLTPQVKTALYDVFKADSSMRIRFGSQGSWISCWVNGKDARDGSYVKLLTALADLASIVLGMTASMAPQPPQPQPQPQQQPQYAPQQYAQQPPQAQYAPQQQYAPQPQQQPQPQYQPQPQQPPQYPVGQPPYAPAQPYPQQQPYPQPPAQPYPQNQQGQQYPGY